MNSLQELSHQRMKSDKRVSTDSVFLACRLPWAAEGRGCGTARCLQDRIQRLAAQVQQRSSKETTKAAARQNPDEAHLKKPSERTWQNENKRERQQTRKNNGCQVGLRRP